MKDTTLLCVILLELEEATKENTDYNKGRIDVCKKVLSSLSINDTEIENIINRAREITR